MLIEEFTAKDSENKNRKYLRIKCDHCSEEYTRQTRLVKTDIHGCSPKCLSILKGERVNVICAHCKSSFTKKKSALNNSKSGLYFCSRECKDIAQTYIEEIRPSHYGEGKYSYREKAFRLFGKICNKCGFTDERALEVHHIDRNRDNNHHDNLMVLCCNCHSIEHKS